MQFLIFEEEKFYASCTLKNKNFAPKQNERDCPMTNGLGKAFIYEGCKQIYLSAGNDLATFRVSLTE